MDLSENIPSHCKMLADLSGVITEDFDTTLWTSDGEYKDTIPFQDGRFHINKKGRKQKRKKGGLDSRYLSGLRVHDKRIPTKRKRALIRASSPDPGSVVPNSYVPGITVPLSERQQIALLMKQTDGQIGGVSAQNSSTEKDSKTLNITKLQEKKKLRDIAILCTEDQQDAAAELTRHLDSEETNTNIIVCQDLVQFTEDANQLHEHHRFYILIGSAMASIMMSKGRLYDRVYDFFQVVEGQGKDVIVLNKLQAEEDSDLVFEFFYQLPKKCRKWYKEIEIKRLSRKEFEQAIDVDADTTTDNSSPKEDLSPSDYLRDPDDDTDSDTTDEENEPRMNVQIGNNLNMNIHTDSNGQLIFAKQEGPRNNMQINIVSPNKKSRVKLVLKSKPTDEEFEEELLSEVKDEVLQINMETTGASNFVVKKGSVIIEMDVESGQSMDFDWICRLLRLIFKDKLAKVLPNGLSLDVEVERNIVVSAEEFESMRNENLHSACVSKERYDELQKQYEETKRELEETMKNENLHCYCVPMDKYEALLQDYEANKKELEALQHYSCPPAVENQSAQSMSKAKAEEWKLEDTIKSEWTSFEHPFSSSTWALDEPMREYEASIKSECTSTDDVQYEELLVELEQTKKELEALKRSTGKSPEKIQDPDVLKWKDVDDKTPVMTPDATNVSKAPVQQLWHVTNNVVYPQIRPIKLSPLDVEKRERRREQNRRAARLCRDKKKNQSNAIQRATMDIQAENDKLAREVQHLKHESEELMRFLNIHMQGKCEKSLQGTENVDYHSFNVTDPTGSASTTAVINLETPTSVSALLKHHLAEAMRPNDSSLLIEDVE